MEITELVSDEVALSIIIHELSFFEWSIQFYIFLLWKQEWMKTAIVDATKPNCIYGKVSVEASFSS